MRKLVRIAFVLVLGASFASAPARAETTLPATAKAGEPTIFAGGGTQLSSGYFFPGTAIENGDEYAGPPLEVPQGSDVLFVNLDHYIVAGGSHQIVSFDTVQPKKKVKGKKARPVPLFVSEPIDGPGQVLMKTSHVKPGEYLYYCPIHNGMLGQIKVVG